MMLNRLPNGSRTDATLMPPPTSFTGSCTWAPSASRRASSAAASGTPQYACTPAAPGSPSGINPSSKPPTENPT